MPYCIKDPKDPKRDHNFDNHPYGVYLLAERVAERMHPVLPRNFLGRQAGNDALLVGTACLNQPEPAILWVPNMKPYKIVGSGWLRFGLCTATHPLFVLQLLVGGRAATWSARIKTRTNLIGSCKGGALNNTPLEPRLFRSLQKQRKGYFRNC